MPAKYAWGFDLGVTPSPRVSAACLLLGDANSITYSIRYRFTPFSFESAGRDVPTVESDEPSRAGFETKRKRVTTAARGRDAQVVTPAGFGSPRDMARLDVLPWILVRSLFARALFGVHRSCDAT